MEKAGTGRAKGVQNAPGGDGRWAENAKKMLFRGNEAEYLLKTQRLAFSGA
jgi:hypothetical protein